MTKKKEPKEEESKKGQSLPEMTALEKRLAEKAALEPEDETASMMQTLNGGKPANTSSPTQKRWK